MKTIFSKSSQFRPIYYKRERISCSNRARSQPWSHSDSHVNYYLGFRRKARVIKCNPFCLGRHKGGHGLRCSQRREWKLEMIFVVWSLFVNNVIRRMLCFCEESLGKNPTLYVHLTDKDSWSFMERIGPQIRPRPHVSGYFLFRNFFFPYTASVRVYPVDSESGDFYSALQLTPE